MENFIKELKTIPIKDTELLRDFCRKKILHGTPFIFQAREDEYYQFRKKIAEQFGISFHEVFITGSAKLGFSPIKDKKFDLDSDIDIALISNDLFEQIMKIISQYQMQIRNNKIVVTKRDIYSYHSFLEYVAIGWIRPDKLPFAYQTSKELKDKWFQYFEGLSNGQSEVGNYKVSAGVFKNYDYFERYTIDGYQQLLAKLQIS